LFSSLYTRIGKNHSVHVDQLNPWPFFVKCVIYQRQNRSFNRLQPWKDTISSMTFPNNLDLCWSSIWLLGKIWRDVIFWKWASKTFKCLLRYYQGLNHLASSHHLFRCLWGWRK
jgi:hypothetical protein